MHEAYQLLITIIRKRELKRKEREERDAEQVVVEEESMEEEDVVEKEVAEEVFDKFLFWFYKVTEAFIQTC